MPACPRKHIVRNGEVAVYHCWNRCVRRAWLCGPDPFTGEDYEYRRQWIARREQLLARLFGIEIGFHCEMSNHLHLVLRTRPDIVDTWSDEEVVRRWLRISKLTRHFADSILEPEQAEVRLKLSDPQTVTELRRRLSSVSWLMACLCEHVSRRANHEDDCRGRFWEDRFRCRELTSEAAILICGIYVDLNPIRAGEAQMPEQASHTSAHDRIEAMRNRDAADRFPIVTDSAEMPADGWMCELTLAEGPQVDVREGLRSRTPWRASDKGLLPIRLEDYLSLLDWAGRQLRGGKLGAIPAQLAPILERLSIRPQFFIDSICHFDQWFGRAIGSVQALLDVARRSGCRWLHGMRQCAAVFG